jgi:hypothetical protein
VAQVGRCAGQWEDSGEIRKRVSWAALLNRFSRFNCRARTIDHLLYERNSGFWRLVTGGRGNVLSIGVKRFLSLGQPLPPPFLIRADSEVLIEFELVHFCFLLVAWRFQLTPPRNGIGDFMPHKRKSVAPPYDPFPRAGPVKQAPTHAR